MHRSFPRVIAPCAAATLAIFNAAPAAAHGLHAAAVDGHDHGALVAGLLVLPVLAFFVVALVKRR